MPFADQRHPCHHVSYSRDHPHILMNYLHELFDLVPCGIFYIDKFLFEVVLPHLPFSIQLIGFIIRVIKHSIPDLGNSKHSEWQLAKEDLSLREFVDQNPISSEDVEISRVGQEAIIKS